MTQVGGGPTAALPAVRGAPYAVEMTETTTPRPAARFIGQSVSRKEDPATPHRSRGYVDDVSFRGMLHAAFLRSEIAGRHDHEHRHQRGQGLPGVVGVYTWQDFDGRYGEAWHAMLGKEMVVPPPLAIGDVRYVGDMVALVVAESRYVAEDACELIEVDYEPTQAGRRLRHCGGRHRAPGARRVGPESNAMVAMPFMPISADLDEAFADGRACRGVHDRAEPLHLRADGDAAASSPRGRTGATRSTSCSRDQSVHETRNFFARYLDIPEGNITVTARDVGGGFGQKMFVFREESRGRARVARCSAGR